MTHDTKNTNEKEKLEAIKHRINRWQYFLGMVVVFLLSIPLFVIFLMVFLSIFSMPLKQFPQMALLATSLVTAPIWLPLGFRRLQDMNNGGWFILISVIPFISFFLNLVLLFVPGTKGENTYGPEPPRKIKFGNVLFPWQIYIGDEKEPDAKGKEVLDEATKKKQAIIVLSVFGTFVLLIVIGLSVVIHSVESGQESKQNVIEQSPSDSTNSGEIGQQDKAKQKSSRPVRTEAIYRSSRDNFAINFPEEPQRRSRTLSVAGQQLDVRAYQHMVDENTPDEFYSYSVSVIDIGADFEQRPIQYRHLNDFMRGYITFGDGDILEQQRLTYRNCKALKYRITRTVQGIDVHTSGQQIFVHDTGRVYFVSVSYLPSDTDEGQTRARTFIESFTLLQ